MSWALLMTFQRIGSGIRNRSALQRILRNPWTTAKRTSHWFHSPFTNWSSPHPGSLYFIGCVHLGGWENKYRLPAMILPLVQNKGHTQIEAFLIPHWVHHSWATSSWKKANFHNSCECPLHICFFAWDVVMQWMNQESDLTDKTPRS